jgi:hydroxymethylglutaryl-CoA synthase
MLLLKLKAGTVAHQTPLIFGGETANNTPCTAEDSQVTQHTTSTSQSRLQIMERCNLKPSDINYFVPHQPNPSFPSESRKKLGFKEDQFMPLTSMPSSATPTQGLTCWFSCSFDVAKPDERILLASYGSGAGSDAYLLRTTSQLLDKRKRQKITVKFQAENPFIEYVDYTTYRRFKQGM